MDKPRLITPALAIVLSFIPGLPVWRMGQTRRAGVILILVLLAGLIFILRPTLATWYLFCTFYIGQMVYSAGLAVWKSPKKGMHDASINANFAVPLPERFRQVKPLNQLVFDTLAKVVRSRSILVTAILGLEGGSCKYQFYGVMGEDLVIADCTASGKARNLTYIPKTEVSWVSLRVGERNCLMKIEFEDDHYPSVKLQIPIKLKKEAIQFVGEFPGNWETDKSASEVILAVHNLGWQPHVWVISLISIGFIILGIFISSNNTNILIIKIISFSFGFFLIAWPYVIWLLRQFKNELAFTSANTLRLLFTLPPILWCWWKAVPPIGKLIIIFLNRLG